MNAISANDNRPALFCTLDKAVAGQAMTITQAHHKFGRCYAEFVAHAGDGRHVLVRKLISSMYKARWSKPLRIERSVVRAVHGRMARQ